MPRPSRLLTLLALTSIAACAVDVAPVKPTKRPSPAARGEDDPPAARRSDAPATASPTPDGRPGAPPAGSPAATSTAAAPARLLAPPAGAVALRGAVLIDAGYAVGTGAAVISNNGGGVLSDYGAGLVANHGAGILSNNGGNLIANNGAGIIANNGGGVISDYGIGVLSNNGGGMIGKTKFYGLAQALGIPPDLAPGGLRPMGGVVVAVASLRRNALLPLGQDAQGAPAYAVLTDEAGGYAVHVPAEEAGNVLVLVRVPPKAAAPDAVDPRLAFALVTAAEGGQAADVDEDNALATHYLMTAYANRLRTLMSTDDPEALIARITGNWAGATPELRALIAGVLREIRAAAEEAGLPAAPRADVERVAQRVVNAMIAQVDLGSLAITKQTYTRWTWPEEPAMAAMTDVMALLRTRAGAALARDPRFFEGQAYLTEANAKRQAAGQAPHAIVKGADLGVFTLREYILQDEVQASYRLARPVFESVDALVDPATGVDQVDRLAGASAAIVGALGTTLVLDQGGARTEALALIRASRPAP